MKLSHFSSVQRPLVPSLYEAILPVSVGTGLLSTLGFTADLALPLPQKNALQYEGNKSLILKLSCITLRPLYPLQFKYLTGHPTLQVT